MKPLWAHQLRAVEMAKGRTNLGLFMEMGTGKTRTALEILRLKMAEERKTLRTLIVCPTVVQFNWKAEIAKYSNINPAHVIILHGTQVERWKALDRTPNYFVVIINYESLLMAQVFNRLKEWAPELIVADESHRVKNPKAARTRALIALGDQAKYKYILSGTPITNNESDLFAQFLFLDGGKTFGKSFFTFRNAWFNDANRKIRQFSPAVKWPKWEPKKHRAEEFKKIVAQNAIAVTKEECLDLPPYIQSTMEVGMAADQARAYKQMKDDYITFVKSSAFTAELAITKALRLAQITSGFLMNTEGEIHHFKNTPKDKALLDLIYDASGKVVVWATWRANQKAIHELLKKEKIIHRQLVGDTSAEDRDRALRDFHDNSDVKVMIASQAAAGVGISLVSANTAIYYSRSFSYEHDAQSAARIHRGGSEIHEKVYRIDLVCPETIDVSCLEALAKKEDLKNQIIHGSLIV
jgi:SNF2 family DNA or RNA helicase